MTDTRTCQAAMPAQSDWHHGAGQGRIFGQPCSTTPNLWGPCIAVDTPLYILGAEDLVRYASVWDRPTATLDGRRI